MIPPIQIECLCFSLYLVTERLCPTPLPCLEHMFYHIIHPLVIPHARKDKRPTISHHPSIAIHDVQTCSYVRCQIRLVDDEEGGLRDTRAAFTTDLVSASNVDDIELEVDEFLAGRKPISSCSARHHPSSSDPRATHHGIRSRQIITP